LFDKVVFGDVWDNFMETELFISTIIKDPFDYTEWQREHYANIDLHEFNMRAVQFDKDNPVGK
jgi:hypothetical protein